LGALLKQSAVELSGASHLPAAQSVALNTGPAAAAAAAAGTQEDETGISASTPPALKGITASLQPLITGDPANVVRGAALHTVLQAAAVANVLLLQHKQALFWRNVGHQHPAEQQGQRGALSAACVEELQHLLRVAAADLEAAVQVEQDLGFLGQLKQAVQQVRGYLPVAQAGQ
jgi:hypothetical protein